MVKNPVSKGAGSNSPRSNGRQGRAAADRALAFTIWLVIGVLVGLAAGVLFDGLIAWLVIGLVAGVLLAWYMDRRNRPAD